MSIEVDVTADSVYHYAVAGIKAQINKNRMKLTSCFFMALTPYLLSLRECVRILPGDSLQKQINRCIYYSIEL